MKNISHIRNMIGKSNYTYLNKIYPSIEGYLFLPLDSAFVFYALNNCSYGLINLENKKDFSKMNLDCGLRIVYFRTEYLKLNLELNINTKKIVLEIINTSGGSGVNKKIKDYIKKQCNITLLENSPYSIHLHTNFRYSQRNCMKIVKIIERVLSFDLD